MGYKNEINAEKVREQYEKKKRNNPSFHKFGIM